MKITALQGSPRKKGNTAKVLEWVKEELERSGHQFESIYLTSKKVSPCLACAKCKDKPDEIGCVQKDDAIEILEKMAASDVVIFATPLYFWGVSAQLKAIIDRTYSLYVSYHQPDHASLIEGRRLAMLATGAGPYENNAEPIFTAFRKLNNPHKTVNAGELYIGRCTTPDNLDASVREQAVQFAGKIGS